MQIKQLHAKSKCTKYQQYEGLKEYENFLNINTGGINQNIIQNFVKTALSTITFDFFLHGCHLFLSWVVNLSQSFLY